MKNLDKEMEQSSQEKAVDEQKSPAHQQQILFADNEMESEQFAPQVKAAADGKQILFNNKD